MSSRTLSLALFFAVSSHCSAQWPQFLGPGRNGISSENDLVDKLPAEGPVEKWRVPGGVGMSGIAVSAGHAFTLIQTDGRQRLACITLATGKVAWTADIAPEYKNQMGDGPRATPTVSGSKVYAYTGDGTLVAANVSDGSLIWSTNLPLELGTRAAEYGLASSPLVVGDQVVVHVGGATSAVVAVTKNAGKIAWKAGGSAAGYSSPTMLNVGSEQQLVSFVGNQLLGIAPNSGELLWAYPFETDYDCNTACPLSVDGRILITSGENHGSVMLDIAKSGGSYSVSEVWEQLGPKSSIRSEWQTPILINGYLYGFDNVGSAGPVTHLVCVDAKSGKQIWLEPRFGKGNLIAADGKLLITTMQGEIVLAKASPNGYQELGRATVIGKTRQAPAVANGLVLLRDDSEIVCLDLRK